MQLKDYQNRALVSLDAWLTHLDSARNDANYKREILTAAGIEFGAEEANYPKHAWKQSRETGLLPPTQASHPYVARTADSGQPIPHVCLKVPTGGGKTLLGAASVERILMHSGENTGLLLWIVPTRAIFDQTKATLWNKQHPYRQWLERSCGGRVKVMEKDDPLTLNDVENYLCVMLVRLQATNRRRSKDFLRMFRNSGKYPGFFPEDDGHPLAQGEFREKYPHLEREPDRDGFPGIVKQSLFNVFKLCRPIVILDEAHKAYGRRYETSAEFAGAINRMDPSMVVELSATPHHRISNVLVDINGSDLQDEEMIKLPIQVETRGQAVNWRHTLELAHQRLEDLTKETEALEAENGRYIRPIAVVRVERTGRNQIGQMNIHAEDVRDHLIALGVLPRQIRVKSAETDELGREDLVNDRLRSPVTWIITKDALKEGWDCPFAYILVLLDTTRAKTAITQMVGRVLRMPQVQLTGRSALDRCYVICHNAEVRATVEFVRNGLESEGMGDLGGFVHADGPETEFKEIGVQRRAQFRGQRIFLPKVLHADGDSGWRELDYDRDIYELIDWNQIAIDDLQGLNVAPSAGGTALVDLQGRSHGLVDVEVELDDTVDFTYFSRALGSVVPNPWRATELATDAVAVLKDSNLSEQSINALRARYAEQFRAKISEQIDEQSRIIFFDKFNNGLLRFDLEADEGNYEMDESFDRTIPRDENELTDFAQPVQRSLFEPVLDSDFNSFERNFAFYIDSKSAILWWHRVAASQRYGYYVRGWRRDRIFPDFVALATDNGSPNAFDDQLLLFETKGAHLENHESTEYKQKVFEFLQQAYNGDLTPSGSMTLKNGIPKGVFRMVFERDMEQALAGTLAGE